MACHRAIIMESDLWKFDWLPSPLWAFDPWDQSMVWANSAGLNFWNSPSIDEFRSRNFSGSDTVQQRNRQIMSRLDTGELVTEHWTMYPRGRGAVQTMATINLLMRENGAKVMLCCIQEYEKESVDKSALRGVEAIRHTQVKIAMFNPSGDALMLNPAALASLEHHDDVTRNLVDSEVRRDLLLFMKLSAVNGGSQDAKNAGLDLSHLQSMSPRANKLANNGGDAADQLKWPERLNRVNNSSSSSGPLTTNDANNTTANNNVNNNTNVTTTTNANTTSNGGCIKSCGQEDCKCNEADNLRKLDSVIFSGEYQLSCVGNVSLWHSIAVRKCLDPVTGVQVFLFQAVDIDEKVAARHAEMMMRQSLADSEQNFRMLYQDAYDAIILMDISYQLREANSAAVRLLGVKNNQEILGQQWTDICGFQGDKSPTSETTEIMSESSDSAESPVPMETADGISTGPAPPSFTDNAQFECYLKSQGSENGKVLCQVSLSKIRRGHQQLYLAVIRDLTKQKELEAQLIRARTEAERLLTVKGQFLAAMSHELRTPLMGIIGSLDVISETSSPQQLSLSLSIIRTSTELMQGIVNNILDLSRLEAGKMPVVLAKVCFDSVIEEIVSLTKPMAVKKGLVINTVWTGPKGLFVWTDGTKIRQIILNLVGNAVKFTEHGEVRITTVITYIEAPCKVSVVVYVKDTGIGIRKGFMPRLFEHFSQADYSTNRKYGGSGLGLAISRRLLDVIGGQISVQSEEGQGTEFKLELELQVASSTSEEYREDCREAPVDSARVVPLDILVVEDNKINQAVFRSLLQQMNHKVTLANDGLEAVDAVVAHDYDVVLMDWMMPHCDGLEATRRIRAQGKTVPILAITANLMPGDDLQCRQSGMNGVLSKPIRKSDLQVALKEYQVALALRDSSASSPIGKNSPTSFTSSANSTDGLRDPTLHTDSIVPQKRPSDVIMGT